MIKREPIRFIHIVRGVILGILGAILVNMLLISLAIGEI